MLTLQRFKTMRLIFGLVVVFGMSVVFHALDAHGHGAATTQKMETISITRANSDSSDSTVLCPVCEKSYRTRTTTTTHTRIVTTTTHYHMNSQLQWVQQYKNESTTDTTSTHTSWTDCGYVYSNGNKCAG